MTNLLLRLFVPQASSNSAAAHSAVGKLAGITGIICNVLLASLKIIAGLVTGSVAITGDGINNLTDSASSIVTLLGFRIAQRPADGEHPFGHGRYEYISGVVVAALVLLAGAELAKSSVEKVLHPQPVPFTVLTLVILLISISVKLWMAGFYRKLGRLIGSKTLEATSQDSRNDVIATSAVVLSFLADGLFHIQLDGFVGLGVAVFILWSGISLAKNTIDPLIGMQADEEMVAGLSEMILSHPRVLGIHDLLIHDYGPGHCFATVHAEMSAGESPLDAHDQLDHIEQEAMHNFGIHLVIHYDPVAETEDWAALKTLAETCAVEVEPAASIHDLRIVEDQGQKKLTFDLAVPYSLGRTDSTLVQAVTSSLAEKGCPLPVFIHVDRHE